MVQLTQDMRNRLHASYRHDEAMKVKDRSRSLPKCVDCRYHSGGDCDHPKVGVDLVTGLPAVSCDDSRQVAALCGVEGQWFTAATLVTVAPPPVPVQPTLFDKVMRVVATALLTVFIYAALQRWLPLGVAS